MRNEVTENDILDFIKEKSKIVENKKIIEISNGYSEYKGSIEYVKDVEF